MYLLVSILTGNALFVFCPHEAQQVQMNQDLEQKIVNISKSPSSQEDLIQLTAEIGQQLLTRNTHLEEQLQFLSLKVEP